MSDQHSDHTENVSGTDIGMSDDGLGLNPRDPYEPWREIDPPWWRCWRRGAVSGRYIGEMTSPNASRFELDLRVDIDPRHQNSPVLDRVSGDIFEVYRWTFGSRVFKWRVFRYSWIVDDPRVAWSRCKVDIAGKMRRWKGGGVATTVTVSIPWSTFSPAGPAIVNFRTATEVETYSCDRVSSCFRSFNLEIDVAQSVNTAPLLPSYNTHSHNNRPADLTNRTLTIESAYDDAGICVNIDGTHTVIDDSDSGFASWSPAELHDAMETHFSKISGRWPKWEMWGLMCGQFDNPGVGGIMFDAKASFGGAGDVPERQGFAVFRNHTWFNDLVDGTPSNQAEAAAMRKFLYTWVHEAGHAFNFLHSWDKSRPDALSWMNYDWRYDNRNGVDSFWGSFHMKFDTEELLHVRHGDRSSVIMGGDEWSSGWHMEGEPEAMGVTEGDAPVELLLRSKRYFDLAEPVDLELRLRNQVDNIPIEFDARFDPGFGAVSLVIQKPDGSIESYEPIFCQMSDPLLQTLQPASSEKGYERFSQEVTIDYGKEGYYFTEPGRYRIRALYRGLGDFVVTSNILTIHVGFPGSREDERFAQDYFSSDAGFVTALGGSRSPFLEAGWSLLEDIGDRRKKDAVGAKAAAALAKGLARPFYRQDEAGKMKRTGNAQTKDALRWSDIALDYLSSTDATNIGYHDIVRWRAGVLSEAGEGDTAKSEVERLRRTLARRGVNSPVLNDIDALSAAL